VKSFFLRWDSVEKCIVIKRYHKYNYQIQMQLNILAQETCFLMAFLDKSDYKIFNIQHDTEFWKKMLPKLNYFWEHCLLPELIDSRLKTERKKDYL